MPVRTYPVSSINDGIKKSLDNAVDLLESSNILLEKYKKKQAFVLYSLAVEEFGKAILLKQKKDEALIKKEIIIKKDDITFDDHRKKIKTVIDTIQNNAIKVRLIDEFEIPMIQPEQGIEQVPEFKGILDYKSKGDFLSFENRVNLLLVDYDEVKKKWMDVEELPFLFSLQSAFDALEFEIDKWRKGVCK